MAVPRAALAGLALLCPAAQARAEEPPASEIVVHGRALQQIGLATSGSQGAVGYADFADRPIGRVGELAEEVPGLIATQHSGEGKANQYFLRGFNLDHGTDLAGYLDGVPLNQRSHAHGQGYLDLNPLIPELVERIDYAKGPYHAEYGDFASAGAMAITTRGRLPAPLAEVAGGSFGAWRGLLAGSMAAGAGDLLGALELARADGPWLLNERLTKANAVLKYSTPDWSLGLSGYLSHWQSTDQIPERAVLAGAIPLYGYVDPTDGGRSGRLGLALNAHAGPGELTLYATLSRLQLTQNFTYFLDDPAHGDQFRQTDRRGTFGGAWRATLGSGAMRWRLGAEARWDRIGALGLYHTQAGQVLATIREDRVDEGSAAMHAEGEWHPLPRLRLVAGLRLDGFTYRVRSSLAANSGTGSAGQLAPKLALAWQPAAGVELYANYGEGYHSNDARGATITVDPATLAPAERVPLLARSRGAELGARVERGALTVSLVGFWLDLASELVFEGDSGSTSANAASRRFGTEAALFWHPRPGLTVDAALAFTHARLRGVAAGQQAIPNAVPVVAGGGISAALGHGLTFSARLRHFSSAPLIEDASQRSAPTTLVNAGLYRQKGHLRLGLEVLNVADSQAPDISYFYVSRLPGEPAGGVAGRHIHPVEPRQIRLSLRFGG
ncbi:MAG: TonB-dependent receptor [Proteobacteria bacterium]|nr:TonB-dependent receptor [Pseudomonadota bacterium]